MEECKVRNGKDGSKTGQEPPPDAVFERPEGENLGAARPEGVTCRDSRPVRLRSTNGFQNRDIRGRQNGFPESRQSWPSGGSGVRAGTEHSSSAAQGIVIAPSVRCALLIGVRVLSQQQQQ